MSNLESNLGVFIGCGWGALIAVPILTRANKAAARSRAQLMENKQAPQRARSVESVAFIRVLGVPARRRANRIMDNAVSRDIPVLIDLLALAAASGCTPAGSVAAVTKWAPPTVSAWCADLASASDRGITFAYACDSPPPHRDLMALGATLAASARSGAPIRSALQRLAESSRSATRQQAEARARAVPIRLLFPLVFTILPAFGLLTLAPVVLGALAGH
ncbi:unannotated protein [freshwater metagenome]|uniref:Unannotated protein n=1 Tax=freshwater metagenome TaxID=449393 RepID=A0A6J6YM91_9ZZZZ|nr:hypothetical protein [Actinomycetota bacterium]